MYKPDPRLSQSVADAESWSACRNPGPLLHTLGDRATDRKLRLFACASWAWLSGRLHTGEGGTHIQLAERFADGLADRSELDAANCASRDVADAHAGTADADRGPWKTALLAHYTTHPDPVAAAFGAVVNMPAQVDRPEPNRRGNFVRTARRYWDMAAWLADLVITGGAPPERAQADLVREVFGNPFRPATLSPNCLTSTVFDLAKGVYDDRAFDRLPILADALQDAGCDNDELLDHLRGPGPHVRGCWGLDLILGKT